MRFLRRHLRILVPAVVTAFLVALTWTQLADLHMHHADGDVHVHAGATKAHAGHHERAHHEGEPIQIDLAMAGLPTAKPALVGLATAAVILILLFPPAPLLRRVAPLPRGTPRIQPPPLHILPPLRAPPLAA